ncbi:hypothetical protein SBF1_9230002 [Candidatus Desulfosporosinus infrequens]|uniref:Uncharacterized protein n=1 Tax=Candidatus Desulfosporosinus infrequens TaxID=2043169 RepID=A0A2U3LXI7_9FIRM|nr:hypothetical protein SBF1_9230002 [Candidatus Desulfosporosinus infrequens]
MEDGTDITGKKNTGCLTKETAPLFYYIARIKKLLIQHLTNATPLHLTAAPPLMVKYLNANSLIRYI